MTKKVSITDPNAESHPEIRLLFLFSPSLKADRRKNARPKIGFTCGAFDLCHAGHMLMFKDCKTVCDYLIVGLQTDPTLDPGYRDKIKNKPVMSFEERRIILEGIKYVDEIVPYSTETDLYNLLAKLRYDVRILGSDWEGKKYTGYDLPHAPYFHHRDHDYSTSQLRARVYEAERERLAGLMAHKHASAQRTTSSQH